ncbi:MAG: polysaccharide deacetylase family protein [Prevotellaceae bacterium]|jgi:hypothetical protein|nr:polysaccharide deacetylase family protein [Prevotellaceae bacterium]
MTKTIQYILRFMLGEHLSEDISGLIGYTADVEQFDNYKIVIVPSTFFKHYGSPKTQPRMPLDTINSVPFLFGTPHKVRMGDTITVHADLVASAYFLLSRYEELINPERDEHGRFLGQYSIMRPYLHKPLVDEYGRLLRSWLRDAGVDVPEPPQKIKKVYLTHDVDSVYKYRSFRQLGGVFLKRPKEILPALRAFFGKIENDPFFTFPFMLEENKKVEAETIFFLKSGKYDEFYDRPYYNLQSKDIQQLIALIKQSGATIGLHTSYTAGASPLLAVHENNTLQEAVNEKVTKNRFHWLRSTNPEEMPCLTFAGITDDFTLGYADVAGFRLGTSRPVQHFNLKKKTVSEHLTLHPLTIMDCTLSNRNYMNMGYEKAFEYATGLIDQTKKNNGELVLLWHNHIFAEKTKFDHKKFYTEILNYIKDNQ